MRTFGCDPELWEPWICSSKESAITFAIPEFDEIRIVILKLSKAYFDSVHTGGVEHIFFQAQLKQLFNTHG
jgi:hypothetical protein